MDYIVIVERGPDSVGAYCPDLPGLGVVGDSEGEALELIRQAVPLHIQSLLAAGEPVPTPTSSVTSVRYDAAA